jgi:hypothetical protein
MPAKPIMYLVIQVQLCFNVCKGLRNSDIWSTASCPNGSKLFHECPFPLRLKEMKRLEFTFY